VFSRLSLVLVIGASTLAITCTTGGGRIPNESVQLAQIRSIEAKLDRAIDLAIRTQLSGGNAQFVAADIAENNENGQVDESGRGPVLFRHSVAFADRLKGHEITTPELQRLRAGLALRIDEAYAAKGDLAQFSDLTSLTNSSGVFTGSINRPAQIQGTH
jgi:hypothetical protein